jgi:uncharacterized SAM-binding protein YcdF (DUF218 family)
MAAFIRRLFVALVAGGLVFIVFDFVSFADRAANSAPPDVLPQADAIVALTGGSGLRISVGMDLLEAGAGKRLLISGVNPDTTRQEIAAIAEGPEDLFACCVDIGQEARTTIGNATEAADWAASHGFKTLILVTSDFHMPRSVLELGRTMPDQTLIAYPVRGVTIDPKAWTGNPRVARLLLTEWIKWRVVWLREALFDPAKGAGAAGAQQGSIAS